MYKSLPVLIAAMSGALVVMIMHDLRACNETIHITQTLRLGVKWLYAMFRSLPPPPQMQQGDCFELRFSQSLGKLKAIFMASIGTHTKHLKL